MKPSPLPLLPRTEDVQKIDQISEELYGISREMLMESVGALSAQRMQNLYPQIFSHGGVSFVCGPGNNGGDGLVMARHLHSEGLKNLNIFVLSFKGSPLFKKQLQRLKLQDIEVKAFQSRNSSSRSKQSKPGLDLALKNLKKVFDSSSLIIDALFGIGLSRDIKDPFLLKLMDLINASHCPVLSLDVPSGLDANRGVMRRKAIKADRTFSFAFSKPGFFIQEGPECVGKQEILSIGVPKKALQEIEKRHFLISEQWIKDIFPQRTIQSHKALYGASLVMAGRPGMWGSGLLASHAAFRIGSGYVFWGSHTEPLECLKDLPEVLTKKTNDIRKELKEKGSLNLGLSQKIKAVVLGPGLGVEKKTASLIENLKTCMDHPEKGSVILDADGITACVKFQLFPLPSHWVLTPHLGELLCILKGKAKEEQKTTRERDTEKRKTNKAFKEKIKKNLFQAAFKASSNSGCQILVKGHHSFLIRKSQCFIIPTGNSALSKAGSGDVLTGMIGGLLAQGLDSFQATLTAAYLHGKIADEWKNLSHETHSLNPSDLKNSFSSIIRSLTKKKK